jgi:hypothetical protein
MDIKTLSLRLETIEAFLSATFEGFYDDVVDVVANKLEGDTKKDAIIAELEQIRAKYTKKRSTK